MAEIGGDIDLSVLAGTSLPDANPSPQTRPR
jgi:hypothetical protein